MFRNKNGKSAAVFSLAVMLMSCLLVACSCEGVPSLRKLLGKNGIEYVTTVAESTGAPETTKEEEPEPASSGSNDTEPSSEVSEETVHEHDWVYTGHKEAMCEAAGYDEYRCSVCGEVRALDEDLYPPLGHNHDGKIEDYAEGKADIGHVDYCTNCGMEYYDTFNVHYYDPVIWIPYPGEEAAYHAYYCLTCYYVNEGSKSPHNMAGDQCTTCGYIKPAEEKPSEEESSDTGE